MQFIEPDQMIIEYSALLEYSNSVFSTLQETSPDAILLVDENAKIVSYNRNFIELWNLPDALVKLGEDAPVLNLVANQVKDTGAFLSRVMHLYAHNDEKSHEELLLTDGRVLDRYSAPVVGENGKYFGRVWYFRDISKQKNAENEQRLAVSIFNASSQAMVITDAKNIILKVNPAFTEITGYEPDEVIGRDPKLLSSGGQDKSFYQKLWAGLHENRGWAGEIVDRRKNGELYVEWLTINAIYGADNSIQNYVALFSDITERKRTEVALNHSNRALATLSAVNRNLMHATDENELLQTVCRTIVEQCGYRLAWVGYLEQDAERSIRPVAHHGFEEGYLENAGILWSDTEKGQGPSGKAARSGQTQIAQNILADESMLPWREQAVKRGYASSITMPLVHQGNVFGVLSIYAKQADAFGQMEVVLLEEMAEELVFGLGSLRAKIERDVALQQLSNTAKELALANVKIEEERARLADRVMERTAQLQFANHAKDSFLATMSHEIRTPLGGMLGMMELLSLSRLTPEQHQMLAVGQTSGKSLLRIVNDILDWSKIEAGKLELAPRTASITEMLNGVASTYTQLASEKNIALRIETDPELGAIYTFDPLRLSQILNNFTSNAIKFTQHGSVVISARRHATRGGYDTVRFSVQDSGIGIDKEQRSRLFQHYEQASADTARMYGGTGLGLSICSRLAELMDGTLSVDSTIGVGSTFSFTVSLPVANNRRVNDVAAPKTGSVLTSAPNVPVVTPLASDGKPYVILIVDDHPINRMLLKQQLELLGLRVETAEDGAKAFVTWQNSHFDLIITDCHMPEMDGYELTRHVRDMERQAGAKRIPIIAWTANVLAEEETHTRAAGMDDLLTKPTELAELKAKLLKWLPKLKVSADADPGVASTTSEVALDLGVLQKFVVDRTAQIEMLQIFKEQNETDVVALQTVLMGSDPATVAQAAHRIKGACRMVGAKELEGISTAIEQAAKQNGMPAARLEADKKLDGAVARLGLAIGRCVEGF